MTERSGGGGGETTRAEPARPPRGARRKVLIHAAFALVGAVVLGLLVRSVGTAALRAALRASAPWLPLVLALELGRTAFEALSTWSLSASVRGQVSLSQLARIHVIGGAVCNVMPAGRATGEAVKAAMLSRFVGAPEATSIGTGNYAAAMLSSVVAAVPCALVSLWLTGWSALTIALVIFAVVTTAAAAAFQVACRRPGIGGALVRRFMKVEQATGAFQASIERIPLVPVVATAAAVAGRALFAVELALLLRAAAGSTGVGQALLALGVSMVGGAVGEMVPGQLGASDGAFALAAPTLGITAADGVAVAMMLHVVQIAWGVAGWTLPLIWKPGPVRAEDGLITGGDKNARPVTLRP